MADLNEEGIQINGKPLLYGILSNEQGYQMYTHPGMTLAEIAFDVMVTIKLLMNAGYLKSKTDFDALVEKYFNDEQYQGYCVEESETNNEQSGSENT